MSESKYRITDLAKEFKTDKDTIIDILKSKNYKVKNMFSAVGEEERAAVKEELGRTAKPVRKESLQSKTPAPKAADRTAKREKQPTERRLTAEKTPAASEKSVLRARTNAPGIVIVRQAPAKTRTETQEHSYSSGTAGSRSARPAGRSGTRPAAAAIPPPPPGEGRSDNRRRGGRGESGAAGSDRSRSSRGGARRDREERTDLRQTERGRGGARKGRKGRTAASAPVQKAEIARPKHIKLPESIAVKDLASKMSYTASDIIKKLMLMGVMASINQEIDYDTAALVAGEFGVTTEELPPDVDPTLIPEVEDDPKSLKDRPPVVTVMGHVDHGKTKLLDALRHTNVVAGEAGGITQAIGAYQVETEVDGEERAITFIDTPGHEAFTAMRARGAKSTDIAVLVIAADDGVMPQTIEALNHAKAADVPIVVAVNKIDKPTADPVRVRGQLSEFGLVPEEYGGETQFVDVSAVTHEGLDGLLEAIILTADAALDLRANPDMPAQGVAIEAHLDKGRGPVATVLVHRGTLRIGDSIVAGSAHGRVRALIDDQGGNVTEALPSMPVQVLGLTSVPGAGDNFLVVEDDRMARQIADKREARMRAAQQAKTSRRKTLDQLFDELQKGETQELLLILKGDGAGSVEALEDALSQIDVGDEVSLRVIDRGVGAITETNVSLAAASKAVIIGFNVRATAHAAQLADRENVDIRYHSVIYAAIDEIESALKGMLKPIFAEEIRGQAEIREIFRSSKFGNIAGCMITEGSIKRNQKARLLRDGVVVAETSIASLRREKDDVTEVREGFECGMTLNNYNDIHIGDVIETFEMVERERS